MILRRKPVLLFESLQAEKSIRFDRLRNDLRADEIFVSLAIHLKETERVGPLEHRGNVQREQKTKP